MTNTPAAHSSSVLLTAVLLPAIVFGQREEEPSAPSSLEQQIAQILRRPEYAGSTSGVLVAEAQSGKVVCSHNADAVLPPASTAKLLSCGGALAVLGPDYRFETPLVRTGPLKDGVVEGDLVLVASGDPNLSQRVTGKDRLQFTDKDHTYAGYTDAELVPGDPLLVLRALVQEAVTNGVREVRGDVVVDDGLFQETTDSFVGDFSAVCVNDNVVDVTVFAADEEGKPPRVEYQPKLPVVKVECQVRSGPSSTRTRIWIEPAAGVASFVVHGTIRRGSRPQLRVGSLRNPALAAAHYLGDILTASGVTVHGTRRRGRLGPGAYQSFPAVARHVSPPFSEAVRVALKVSHNLHATMLPVVVGALKKGRGERTAGYATIRGLLEREGIEVDSVVLQSGSGGAAADRVSPRFLVDYLRYMARRTDFPYFYRALPIGGVDGTLALRCSHPDLRRRVRAKTGTLVYRGSFNDRWIYLSKALAGYLDPTGEDRPEERLAFAILIANTVTEDRQRGVNMLFRAQEEILRAVVARRTKRP